MTNFHKILFYYPVLQFVFISVVVCRPTCFASAGLQGGPINCHICLYALTSYAVTSSNINWPIFSNLIHRLNQENICNNAVTKPHLKWVATTGNNVFIVSVIVSVASCSFFNQMFNLSALLLDYALLTGRLKTRDLTARPSKLWRLISRNWTTRHHIARVDIARRVSLCE